MCFLLTFWLTFPAISCQVPAKLENVANVIGWTSSYVRMQIQSNVHGQRSVITVNDVKVLPLCDAKAL